MDKTNGNGGDGGKAIPPYLSALTLLNALAYLSEQGLPAQIDSGILSKFSGSDRRALFPALRFIGFCNDENVPTQLFHKYANADESARKEILADVLNTSYPNQVKYLANGTPQQLSTAFAEFPMEASVRAKCISFFLKLAKVAGLPMSPYIAKQIRATVPRKTGKQKAKSAADPKGTESKPKNDTGVLPEIPGMVVMPITFGPGKTWYIQVPQSPDAGDAAKFSQVVNIVLGVK